MSIRCHLPPPPPPAPPLAGLSFWLLGGVLPVQGQCRCRRTTFDFGAGNRKCAACGHAPMRHYSYFNRAVLTPVQRYGYRGMGRLAFRTLRSQVSLARALSRKRRHACTRPGARTHM